MTKKHVEKISFTNEIGQTLNPGDFVVFVTTGFSHRIKINTGIYEGIITTSGYPKKRVKISGINKKRFIWNKKTLTGYHEDYIGTTSLQRNRVFKLGTF